MYILWHKGPVLSNCHDTLVSVGAPSVKAKCIQVYCVPDCAYCSMKDQVHVAIGKPPDSCSFLFHLYFWYASDCYSSCTLL